jgi:hypothetical protein
MRFSRLFSKSSKIVYYATRFINGTLDRRFKLGQNSCGLNVSSVHRIALNMLANGIGVFLLNVN